MVKSCSAYGCTERAKKGGISFHAFPKDEELRQKWIVAVRRKAFIPSKSSTICGKHFLEDDFRMHCEKRVLKDSAVPSVFVFTPHLCKNRKKKRNRKKVLAISEKHCTPLTSEALDIIKEEKCTVILEENHNYSENNKSSETPEIVNEENCTVLLEEKHNYSENNKLSETPELVTEGKCTAVLEENHNHSETNRSSKINKEKCTAIAEENHNCYENNKSSKIPDIINRGEYTLVLVAQNHNNFQDNRTRNMQFRYFGDYNSKNLETMEAKHLWNIANKQIKKYQKTIKTLRNKQHGLMRKINSLQDLVTDLKCSNKNTSVT